jgi:flagellar biosynthesis/type III secretory pathway M-ring protein FliF/YscJ
VQHVLVAMALFGWVMIGIFVIFVGAIVLLGLYSPRSGADVLGWRPTRSREAEVQNELDDVAQMLEASNALRRRRGAAERTEHEVADAIRADQRDLDRRARDYGEPDGADP